MTTDTPQITFDETPPDNGSPTQRHFGRRRGLLGRRLGRMGRVLLDVVFPPLCLGCETRLMDHHALCPSCWRQIDFIRPPLCDRLGMPLTYTGPTPIVSAAAVASPPIYDKARAVALYDGLMRDLVHRLKYSDRHEARRLFARWLIEAGHDLLPVTDVIVPIPLSRYRLLARRFNQAQLIATDLGRRSGIKVDALALTRRHTRHHQVDLTRAERQRNVAGVFSLAASVGARITGKRILLVDDVITTGATVSAAARVLKAAGAAEVNVLALALTRNG